MWTNIAVVVAIVAFLLLALETPVLVALAVRHRSVTSRYRAVIDIDAAVAQRQSEAEKLRESAADLERTHAARKQALSVEYERARSTYERLRKEVAHLEENLEDISFGLYTPHYSFDTADEYKEELGRVRERKKELVRAEQAVVCPVEWSVGGSRREGERMQKQLSKLMLRAFNGECDAALANVTWNNVTRMEERIQKSYEAINKLGTVIKVSLTERYLQASLAELRLAHEHEEKKRADAEEQRRIREELREEERALREAEKAKEQAEAEEVRFQKALDKARAEVAKATDAERGGLNDRIQQLEAQLEEAHRKRERALSMAQQTRSGHVYVISNIGCFGEEVFKIGMTRRLEPLDRVKELGDASVPFEFDVHAMIYTTDAPGLENAFHREFSSRRVNRVNLRKEFFQVTLAEVEEFAKRQGIGTDFVHLAEARDYRQTVAMAQAGQQPQPSAEDAAEAFPDDLFARA
jgi:hypothetical protein